MKFKVPLLPTSVTVGVELVPDRPLPPGGLITDNRAEQWVQSQVGLEQPQSVEESEEEEDFSSAISF